MTWQIGYTFADEKGHKSRMTLNFNDTLTVPQVQELNIILQDILKPGGGRDLAIGGIVGAGAVLSLPVQAGMEVVADLSRVEYGALFDFLVTGGFHTSFRIPTFNELFIGDGGSTVVQTEPEISALINGAINGFTVTGGTATMQDYRGTDVTSISSAAEDNKTQRK